MQDSENSCRPELDELIRKIRNFVEERDWDQFHSPKNLAMALAVEASELVEIFQWMTERRKPAARSEAETICRRRDC